jgi:hypothetical protein
MTLRRHGVLGSELDGVFFTESPSIEGARLIGAVKVKVPGQNKDIRDVKAALAARVRSMGGNGLLSFTYGQQGNPWWASFGLFDSEHWYGSGTAAVLPPASAREIDTP